MGCVKGMMKQSKTMKNGGVLYAYRWLDIIYNYENNQEK